MGFAIRKKNKTKTVFVRFLDIINIVLVFFRYLYLNRFFDTFFYTSLICSLDVLFYQE